MFLNESEEIAFGVAQKSNIAIISNFLNKFIFVVFGFDYYFRKTCQKILMEINKNRYELWSINLDIVHALIDFFLFEILMC